MPNSIKNHSGKIAFLLSVLSLIFLYQNCGKVSLGPVQMDEKASCGDSGQYEVFVPVGNSDLELQLMHDGLPYEQILDWQGPRSLPVVPICGEVFHVVVKFTTSCAQGATVERSFEDPRCVEDPQIPPATIPTTTIRLPEPAGETMEIPGWTGLPPSPNSCSMGVGSSLPTSPEPRFPEACRGIPGRPEYPKVLLENSEGGLVLSRDMDYTHAQQAPAICEANSGTAPVTQPGHYYIRPNSFYAVRFVAQEGERGFFGMESTNGEDYGGSISISECPGDFGKVYDWAFMQRMLLNSGPGERVSPAPAANTRTVNRALFYQNQQQRAFNQQIPVDRLGYNFFPFERCLKDNPGRGIALNYKTTSYQSEGDYATDNGCLLQAGKTYYINFSNISLFTNKAYRPSAQALSIKIKSSRSCRERDASGVLRSVACAPVP